jgi:hypothetical protein
MVIITSPWSRSIKRRRLYRSGLAKQSFAHVILEPAETRKRKHRDCGWFHIGLKPHWHPAMKATRGLRNVWKQVFNTPWHYEIYWSRAPKIALTFLWSRRTTALGHPYVGSRPSATSLYQIADGSANPAKLAYQS